MDVLIMGGSVFLGRAVAERALAAGHHVSVFNRGRSGATPPGAEQLTGDRTTDLSLLKGRRFDVVVDTSGYVPADVGRSAHAINSASYVFISTISVYPAWPDQVEFGSTYEGDPTATAAPDDFDPAQAYGWLKVGCERAVRAAVGDRATVLRAGSIVGPNDNEVGRLPWWIDRVARGGEVLVPGTPQDPMSLIDARDLADFALLAVPGTFDVAGPSGRDTRGELMRSCRAVTGAAATFEWVDEQWLAQQDVEPWTEIPLWAPDAPGLFAGQVDAAAAAGMQWRPLVDTVRDTWVWQQAIDWRPTRRTPGLTPTKENLLLVKWRSSTGYERS